MKFLIDMNLSPGLTAFFEREGFEAVHWATVGDARTSDREIVRWAREHGYTVITNDLDFGTILAVDGEIFPSVIQIRRLELFPPLLFPVLQQAMEKYRWEIEQGALVVVDEKRIRTRTLPLIPR